MTVQRGVAHASSITVERLPGLAVRFRLFLPAKIQKGFNVLCTVFHLEAPACLGDLKTQKVHCVSFVPQHHHIRPIQTGRHVIEIFHEMFVWSRTNHVIRVTRKDRII